MALRKPRTSSRLNTKSSQRGLTEREEDEGERGEKPRKRKLSDIGPAWSKDDLEAFYQAYRKYGKDWKKVAGSMQKRTMEMVEAVYGMNRAYLSLPEGAASAAGLIAMMTDRYNILDESGEESSEEFGTSDRSHQTQSQLRTRATSVNNSNFGSSGYGGPSPAKKPRSAAASRPWGKRTPRYPSGNLLEQKGKKVVLSKVPQHETSDDDNDLTKEAEVVARTLVTASQQLPSPLICRNTTTRRFRGTSFQNGHAKEASSKAEPSGSRPKHTSSTNGEGPDGCFERKEMPGRASSSTNFGETEMANGVGVNLSDDKSRWKKPSAKKLKLKNLEMECDEPNEQLSQTGTREDDSIEQSQENHISGQNKKRLSSQRTKNRSRQLFLGDQSNALDALAALVAVSLDGCPPSPTPVPDSDENYPKRSGSSFPVLRGPLENNDKEEEKDDCQKHGYNIEKPEVPVFKDDSGVGTGSRQLSVSPPDARKRKRKAVVEKLPPQVTVSSDDQDQIKAELQVAPVKVETPVVLKPRRKPKRVTSAKAGLKQAGPKTIKVGDTSDLNLDLSIQAAVQFPKVDEGTLPLKLRSKKKGPVNGLRDGSKSELAVDIVKETAYCPHGTAELGPFNVKARLTHCLSPKVQRWCMYEWFYSAIDLPWFAHNEFVEYLNHAGLGHVPRLTRVEWGVIRSSLGKPRRLSKSFLNEEREKLSMYRENVRRHYHELRSGLRKGLPSDLARPLTVGQRVIARHPKTKRIHDGSILTVDRSKCRVQFDRPELGVEFVLDIDAMPINPLENMPEIMRRKRIILDGLDRTLEDVKQSRSIASAGGAARAALNERLERIGSTPSAAVSSQMFLNNLIKIAQLNTLEAVRVAKATTNEAVTAAQQALKLQPYTPGQSQAKESEIRNMVELGGSLNNKELLLVELRRMNEEPVSQKCSDVFKRQHETVTQRLKEVNDKVSDALQHLRLRNKHHEIVVQSWQRAGSQVMTANGASSIAEGRVLIEAGLDVADISTSAKKHARAMVSAAIQSMSVLKEGEDPLTKIGGALDRITRGTVINQIKNTGGVTSLGAIASTASTTLRDVETTLDPYQSEGDRMALKSVAGHAASLNIEDRRTTELLNHAAATEGNEAMILSELTASCVATLLMVQTLAEHQVSAQVVSLVLDSALENLRPQAAQNHYIFKDIQQQMELIKSQLLSHMPMQSNAKCHSEPLVTQPNPT